MSEPTINPISPEDRKRWDRQNLADLLQSAQLSFARKIQMLEEVARAFHGGKLPRSPDEHEEQS